MNKFALAASLMLATAATVACADEGMWTPDNLPKAQVQANYGFTPDTAWADARAEGRVAPGRRLLRFVRVAERPGADQPPLRQFLRAAAVQRRERLTSRTASSPRTAQDEIKCPEIELNRLDTITDVTARVTQGDRRQERRGLQHAPTRRSSRRSRRNASARTARRRAATWSTSTTAACYNLYQYHRYQDVRLVFAPELAIAFFGGDPDNFNFPRYDLDMGLLRVYEDGKPAKVADYFPFSTNGADRRRADDRRRQPGRHRSPAHHRAARVGARRRPDRRLFLLAETRGLLEQYRSQSAENARIAQQRSVRHRELVQGAARAPAGAAGSGSVRAQAQPGNRTARLRRRRSGAQGEVRRGWDEIAKPRSPSYRNIETRYKLIEGRRGFSVGLLTAIARTLVRAADERAKPNAERLREYHRFAGCRASRRACSRPRRSIRTTRRSSSRFR